MIWMILAIEIVYCTDVDWLMALWNVKHRTHHAGIRWLNQLKTGAIAVAANAAHKW